MLSCICLLKKGFLLACCLGHTSPGVLEKGRGFHIGVSAGSREANQAATSPEASQQPDCTPGHLWTCVDMRGHVWTCVDICEHLWTLHSAGRSDLADIGGHLWTSVDMRGHVWTCVDMCGH